MYIFAIKNQYYLPTLVEISQYKIFVAFQTTKIAFSEMKHHFLKNPPHPSPLTPPTPCP
jgi:hypothetical protein